MSTVSIVLLCVAIASIATNVFLGRSVHSLQNKNRDTKEELAIQTARRIHFEMCALPVEQISFQKLYALYTERIALKKSFRFENFLFCFKVKLIEKYVSIKVDSIDELYTILEKDMIQASGADMLLLKIQCGEAQKDEGVQERVLLLLQKKLQSMDGVTAESVFYVYKQKFYCIGTFDFSTFAMRYLYTSMQKM